MRFASLKERDQLSSLFESATQARPAVRVVSSIVCTCIVFSVVDFGSNTNRKKKWYLTPRAHTHKHTHARTYSRRATGFVGCVVHWGRYYIGFRCSCVPNTITSSQVGAARSIQKSNGTHVGSARRLVFE